MGYRLGVDLGTTYTAAAVNVDGRVEMLGLGIRAMQVPSVVFIRDEGEVVVGEAAEQQGAADPSRLVREFKRRIGDAVPLIIGGSPYSAQALTARLLAWVVGIATERQGGPPEHVCVTHPANWGPFKRDLLGQAIEMAGLRGVETSTRTEPEAAAIAYASRDRVAEGDRVAVYDLGGGTFDAAVLVREGAGFRLAGPPEGVEHLGGIDFDEAVFRHVLTVARGRRRRRSTTPTPPRRRALARLRRDCVEAKEVLSFSVDTVVPVALPGITRSVRLTRGELDDMLRPAIGETVAATRRVLDCGGRRAGRPGGDPAGRWLVADPAGERAAVGGVRAAAGAGQPSQARRRAGRGDPGHPPPRSRRAAVPPPDANSAALADRRHRQPPRLSRPAGLLARSGRDATPSEPTRPGDRHPAGRAYRPPPSTTGRTRRAAPAGPSPDWRPPAVVGPMHAEQEGSGPTSAAATRRRRLVRTPSVLIVTLLMIVSAGAVIVTSLSGETVHREAVAATGALPPFVPANGNPGVPLVSGSAVENTAAVTGDTPGLYGGTRSDTCNAEGIRTYLEANPAKAQAWATAMEVPLAQVSPFLASLTPVTLRTDTAVTNHGFKDGVATPFQSVLQAGTAVLVDPQGLPRVRCYCGNPLGEPDRQTSARYTGAAWNGFSGDAVTVIAKAPAQVSEFVVVEPDTDEVVKRPRGTSGDKDRAADPETAKKVKRSLRHDGAGGPASDPATHGPAEDDAVQPIPDQDAVHSGGTGQNAVSAPDVGECHRCAGHQPGPRDRRQPCAQLRHRAGHRSTHRNRARHRTERPAAEPQTGTEPKTGTDPDTDTGTGPKVDPNPGVGTEPGAGADLNGGTQPTGAG